MQYLKFQGAMYRQAEPPVRLVDPLDYNDIAEQIRAELKPHLENALFDQQQQHTTWHEGLKRLQQLAAEVSQLEKTVEEAKKYYHGTQEDVQYYQEVLEKLDQKDWDWLRAHSWMK